MRKIITSLAICLVLVACSNDDDNNAIPENQVTKAEVLTNYANIVYQSYLDSYNGAVSVQTAVNTFLATKNEVNYNAIKTAWLAAREPYGQTEAYRFASGPIDEEGEPWSIANEGQMNAWPLEEAIIDYVSEDSRVQGAGIFSFNIISDASITIDESSVISFNEYENNESAVTTGWHAIEFLLWGQDNTNPADDKPGVRTFTDYTTEANADRRGEYLKIATDLLVKDLNDLVTTWNVGGAYRTVFNDLDENTALQQIITGPFTMVGDELSSERMLAPVKNTGGLNGWGQEDEHSCFSDNTHRDIFTNAQGSYNVIFGKYDTISGASFYDLVKQANPEQAQILKNSADEAMAKVAVIVNNDKPFDYLITKEEADDTNKGPVLQAVDALMDLGNEISASASAIGINLN
ncbi:imelysin family protein [uncultured Algibacter sp.]|uniref:imelysin family protein n=1 Tax=uncultured Algibacter sp. TaxID=298659 RepID=UPI003217DAD5